MRNFLSPDKRTRTSAILLFCAQVLAGSAIIMLTMVSGLVGITLAPHTWLATAPNSMTVLGTLLGIIPFSRLIQKFGWRLSLLAGLGIGFSGALIAAVAIAAQNFYLYIIGCILIGGMSASVQYYTYAGADLAKEVKIKRNIISLITFAGLISAFLSPELLRVSPYLHPESQFSGAFIALSAIIAIAGCIIFGVRFPQTKLDKPKLRASGWSPVRMTSIYGMTISACAFSLMTLLMHGSPIAMKYCGHTLEESASVLQWHFVAMYAPAIIAGRLMNRFSPATGAALGMVVGLAACVAAYMNPTVPGFALALILAGVAWSLMFTAGTSIVAESDADPVMLAKTQGLANLVVYIVNSISSFSTAPLLTLIGWQGLSLVAVLPLCISAFCVSAVTMVEARSVKQNQVN